MLLSTKPQKLTNTIWYVESIPVVVVAWLSAASEPESLPDEKLQTNHCEAQSPKKIALTSQESFFYPGVLRHVTLRCYCAAAASGFARYCLLLPTLPAVASRCPLLYLLEPFPYAACWLCIWKAVPAFSRVERAAALPS